MMIEGYIERRWMFEKLSAMVKSNAAAGNIRSDIVVSTAIDLINKIDRHSAADVVEKSVFEQVKYERDMAIQQLDELGISLGAVAPDVVKAVRCRECVHRHESEFCECRPADFYCAEGEKKGGAE